MSWLNRIIQAPPTEAAQNLLIPDADIPEEPVVPEEVEDVNPEGANIEIPAAMPNYDATHADDEGDNAMEKAMNALRGKEWGEDDLKFYFQQIEIKMKSAGVKSNFTKLVDLVNKQNNKMCVFLKLNINTDIGFRLNCSQKYKHPN